MPAEWLWQLWLILCCLFLVTAIVAGLFIWPCLVANERRQLRIFEENQAYWIEVEKIEKLIVLEQITQERLALSATQTVMPEKDMEVPDVPAPPA